MTTTKTNNDAHEVSAQAAALLKYYVYVYSHPQTGKPFYVGKGKGGRMFAHLDVANGANDAKSATINAIRKSGKEPHIDILRYGLSESEALLVEAAAIDLIGKDNLANLVSGVTRGYGRISAREFLATFEAKSAAVRHLAVLIKISRLYRGDMSARELYETTRGAWVIGKRRERAEYAIAIFRGIAKEVYRISKWHSAGTLKYHDRDISGWKHTNRWEFEGEVAEESVRRLYVGRKVGENNQNPIRYANI
ncbi:MAG: LEM-3-like GIY-YIG domain-containing protein [Gammaproteobacteria bacterium]